MLQTDNHPVTAMQSASPDLFFVFFQTSKVTLLNLQLSDILPIRFSILWRLDTNSHIRLFNTDPGLIEHRWEFGSGEDGKERKRGRRRGVWNRVKFFKSLSLLNLHA